MRVASRPRTHPCRPRLPQQELKWLHNQGALELTLALGSLLGWFHSTCHSRHNLRRDWPSHVDFNIIARRVSRWPFLMSTSEHTWRYMALKQGSSRYCEGDTDWTVTVACDRCRAYSRSYLCLREGTISLPPGNLLYPMRGILRGKCLL